MHEGSLQKGPHFLLKIAKLHASMNVYLLLVSQKTYVPKAFKIPSYFLNGLKNPTIIYQFPI